MHGSVFSGVDIYDVPECHLLQQMISQLGLQKLLQQLVSQELTVYLSDFDFLK